ncbi:uncharacterized protein LOC109999883 isoform X4 [Xyrichtys novacula]|uniref:Uncharacterized protein LOC109999883 isoform X4 n=1 Tax=Xyrichtys novacula TaxID=13765 RepID=A0AAV1GEP2_XYRNO|nr:uncharacterized protein LOC109999883 isoform X4 [Xyrichtys novacula]
MDDRYDNLDLDLECEGGGVAQKAALFGGMFKRSSKIIEPSAPAQDSLSASGELSKSRDSLTDGSTKEKGNVFKDMFKKTTKANKEDSVSLQNVELSASSENLTENNKTSKEKLNVFGGLLKRPHKPGHARRASQESGGVFSGMFKKSPKPPGAKTQSQEDLTAPSELSGSTDNLSVSSNTKKDAEDSEEMLKEKENQAGEKPKTVKGNMIQRERKERSETPLVPPRPTEEEMKRTSTYDKMKSRGTDDNQGNKDTTPAVAAKPSEEVVNRTVRQKQKKDIESQSDDDILNEEGNSQDKKVSSHYESNCIKYNCITKVKKHKRHNPFLARGAAKAQSDDEGLKEEDNSSSKEEKKDEEDKEKTEEAKVKKPKRHNPFLTRIKGKAVQRQAQDGAGNSAENEGGNRSLFDQLEDYRIDGRQPEDRQDVEDLMEWWNTVEAWEETPQDDDMTEKEEAKAFAVTADKVQKGIRVFNKLFSERAETLWQHVIDLNGIADGLDKFSKNTKIAQITGGSTSAIGGVATIAGLALAPVTMGTSLIVTAVGLGVATAGGLTSAGAGISNQVNNSMDRKKVEKIVQDYQEKITDLNKCLKFIKQGIENLKRFDLMKMKKHAYNRDFPVLSASFYEDGAMAGKAILINANEIMRVVQIANVAGSTAARAVQIASMATGVLTGLFVGMDIYFVAKDSKELKKGAKSEFAAKIREVATQLHDGLVELNSIRDELQATQPEDNPENNAAPEDTENKDKGFKYEDEEEEDEIDRIKKAIKADYEKREYV